jgi:hypothetical protein
MHAHVEAPTSRGALWTGRIITLSVAAFLLFDGAVKVLGLKVAVDATVALGYPAALVVPIGVVELVCLAVYLVPRTSMLGGILLTGFLGGAIAAQARLENPSLLFAAAVGILVWAGILLRDRRRCDALALSPR